MKARTLMVFGTASDAGKSTLVSALCRAFAREGVSVAPFKAQNMARNAYVCEDGGEIGVAQAVQALAARTTPHVDHNPILLKPEPGFMSQVIVHGKSLGRHAFADIAQLRPTLLDAMQVSLARLRAQHALVVMEGAGSPAELNLQAHDLPNLAAARAADAEILLVADIDRGGVFASILGTLALLPDDLRPRVRGVVINKLRGDASLLGPGLRMLEERTGVPVLGVIPFLHDHDLPDEDSLALDRHRGGKRAALHQLEIAVVDTPCIANFEDLLPLEREPGVVLRLSSCARELLEADLVVLAGSKSTVHDLRFLRETGIAEALGQRAARGAAILGICGGAQMLGMRIEDPHGVESEVLSTQGLGLLPHHTCYEREKLTQRVRGSFVALGAEAQVDGFFLHHGRLLHAHATRPALQLDDGSPEGSVHGAVIASMVHRLFDQPSARQALITRLCAARNLPPPTAAAERPDPYDTLADQVCAVLDWQALRAIALGT